MADRPAAQRNEASGRLPRRPGGRPGGKTGTLLPLYVVGVFLAFTLSQDGMIMHWRRHRDQPHWRRSLAFNAIGALPQRGCQPPRTKPGLSGRRVRTDQPLAMASFSPAQPLGRPRAPASPPVVKGL